MHCLRWPSQCSSFQEFTSIVRHCHGWPAFERKSKDHSSGADPHFADVANRLTNNPKHVKIEHVFHTILSFPSMMMDRQVTVPGSASAYILSISRWFSQPIFIASAVASSKLFSNVFTLLPKDGPSESICPSDELSVRPISLHLPLSFLFGGLSDYFALSGCLLLLEGESSTMAKTITTRQPTDDWNPSVELLCCSDPRFQVVYGSIGFCRAWGEDPAFGNVTRIDSLPCPNSKLLTFFISSYESSFQAKSITEKDGWPSIFADAFIARWNTKSVNNPTVPVHVDEPSTENVAQKVARSVIRLLGHLKVTFRSRYMQNIISNIELAAAYLAIMTLVRLLSSSCAQCLHYFFSRYRGLWIFPWITISLRSLRNACGMQGEWCSRSCTATKLSFRSQSEDQFSDILKILNLTLVEFQAPLFCSLAISPILLFRTCQLQSSRFGRQYYLSVSYLIFYLITRIPHSYVIVYDESWGHQTCFTASDRDSYMEKSLFGGEMQT